VIPPSNKDNLIRITTPTTPTKQIKTKEEADIRVDP
jgi:hypothetical protein